MWPLKRKKPKPVERRDPTLNIPVAPGGARSNPMPVAPSLQRDQQPQMHAAPPTQEHRAAAPVSNIPQEQFKDAVASNDPRTGAHVQLRTLKKQGPGFGNVAPLGALDEVTSKKLFEQKPTKALPKRDPAPSRTRYRIQRLWLTPLVRRAVIRGLPLVLIGALALLYLSDADRQARIASVLTETREKIQSHPEFRVELLKITGTTPELSDQVRFAAGLTLPMTSFDLDLEKVRKRIEDLDEVKAASLFLRTGGLLEVSVEPREPVVLWRTASGLQLLDYQGVKSGNVTKRDERPELPVIAGLGANENVAEAMRLITVSEPIKSRMRGLRRVSDRRWDVVLDRRQTIKLPATNPVTSLERLLALDEAHELLNRDIVSVDMRNPERVSVRMEPNAGPVDVNAE